MKIAERVVGVFSSATIAIQDLVSAVKCVFETCQHLSWHACTRPINKLNPSHMGGNDGCAESKVAFAPDRRIDGARLSTGALSPNAQNRGLSISRVE